MIRLEPEFRASSRNRQGPRTSVPKQVPSSYPNINSCTEYVKCKIYFTNFPDWWESCHFREIFKNYGEICDIFIPATRNFRGQRFGFITFSKSTDVNSFLVSLNQIWIGGYKLRFYIAKDAIGSNVKCQPSQKHEDSHKTYAEVVKGANGCPHASPNTDVQSDPKESKVGNKTDSIPDNRLKGVVGSFFNNCADSHVEVSLKNGVLIIKINVLELLSSDSSDSEENHSTTKNCKSPTHESQKIEVPLVDSTKVVKPNVSIAADIKQRSRQVKSKSLARPLKPLWNRVFPFSSNQYLGEKPLVISKDKSSSCRDGRIALSSPNFLVNANANLDQGLYCHESDTCADLGSPCFSVHTRSSEDLNMAIRDDLVDKELSGGCHQFTDDISSESVPRELEELNQNTELVSDNDDEYTIGSDEELVNSNLHKTKEVRKKKKRKNYMWSRKKIHSRVKTKVQSPSKFTVEDTCISDSCYRDEAIKTLEVAKILGISFMDEDEAIINKMLEMDLEERNEHDRI